MRPVGLTGQQPSRPCYGTVVVGQHTSRMPRFSYPKNDLARKLIYFALTVCLLSVLLLSRESFSTGPSHIILQHNSSPTPQSHGPQDAPLVPVPEPPTPVVFSLIMWSKPSAIEGTLLIKVGPCIPISGDSAKRRQSIIMYSSKPADIHIICDDEAEKVVRTRLDLLKRPSHQVRVWFHKPTWQGMLDRVEREGTIQTDHSAGLRKSRMLSLYSCQFLTKLFLCIYSWPYEAIHPRDSAIKCHEVNLCRHGRLLHQRSNSSLERL